MIGRNDLALDIVNGRRSRPIQARHKKHLEHGNANCAPHFLHHGFHQFILASFHNIGSLEEDLAFCAGWCVCPFRESRLRGFDGTPSIFTLACCQAGINFSGVGIHVLESFAVGGLHPLAADKHLMCLDSHLLLLLTR